MRLVALDPGGTTGTCLAVDGLVRARGQIAGCHHKHLYHALEAFMPDRIVCEGFTFRQSKDQIVLDSVEYIGVTKLYCQDKNVPYIEQTSAQGKASSENVFWNMDKLKAVGLWLEGQPHANDATSHMLYYMTFTLKQPHYLNILKGHGF